MTDEKAKLIAKALYTKEGRKMLGKAMEEGVIRFRDEYFSKWDKEHQDRFLFAAFGYMRR